MKQLKIIVALVAGLFAFTSAQAGELSVTGSMQATYQSESNLETGNPLGMNTDMKFSGSTDTDFGTATWSMATDGAFLGGANGNSGGNDHKMTLATSVGTIGLGNTGDAANAIDDITPTAFEEANGSGSGSYATDFGSGMDGSMSLSYSNGDLLGTGISVAYNYYPQLDGVTNNEKGASGTQSGNSDSASSINLGIPLSNLPIVGDSPLGGMKLSLGYEESDSRTATAQDKLGATVAVTLPVGPLKIGYQKKSYQAAQDAILIANRVFFKDDIYGIAYAINDDLAISYNVIESTQHAKDGINDEQESKSINAAYTVGGLTIAFADAKTSNSGYVKDTDNDTRTLSIKTAF
jgi:hypothetical protein